MKYLKFPVILVFLIFCCCKSTAQQDFNPEYVKVTNDRAQKIVDDLGIENLKKELKVRDIIAGQYRALSKIQEEEEAELAVLKSSKMSEELKQSKKEAIASKIETKTKKLHKEYIKNLKKQLNTKQVTQVKDGMTYGVVEITYEGYQDMLQQLTEEEKKYIYENLVEARELAMDAGSSKEKHAWFGKYKGRINNYLSQRGYDLNAESEAWHKRIEARKKEENNN